MNSKLPALFLLVTCTAAVANDWPRFRGPHGDNSVPDAKIVTSFPESGPKKLWTIPVNAGYGGAAIAGEEVFFMDRVDQQKDVLTCVGLLDGKERWKWEHEVPGRISHPGSRTVPTVTDEAVYGSSGFGHIYCVDRKSGEKRWVVDVAESFDARPPRFGYAVHPVIHGEHCIIAPIGDDVGLAALDMKTGKTIWRSESIGDSHSSPLLVKLLGREMLVMPGSTRGTLVFTGIDLKTGKRLFRYTEPLSGGIHNSIPNIAVIDTDTAFLTGGYGQGTKVLKFTEIEGAISVTRSNDVSAGATIHPPLLIDDHVFITAGRSRGGRGGRFGGRFRGRPDGPGGPGGRRPEGRPEGPGGPPSERGPRPDRQGRGPAGNPSGNPAESGLICMNSDGKVVWSTGDKPGFGGGSIINAGGIIVSQDGDDGTLRLIKPGQKYQELASGKIFGDDPGNELWAPLALSKGLLVMRSQKEVVCVDLRPTEAAERE